MLPPFTVLYLMLVETSFMLLVILPKARQSLYDMAIYAKYTERKG